MSGYRNLTTFLFSFWLLVSVASAADSAASFSYMLQDSYTGSNFFSKFNFFADADPTHGFVQ
jgi:hypothetical protein